MTTDLLDEPFPLTAAQLAFYNQYRFIKLKQVLDAATIARYNALISKYVHEHSADQKPLHKRDTYGKAFLQLCNLWQADDGIKQLVCSRRLAQIAAALMQVDGVRIYHDQALFKEAGGGITPWHADQYYWPLATDKTITAWIPLQATPLAMGPLEFSAGSHAIHAGRDLKIGDESEVAIGNTLRITDFAHVVEPFDLGEVSFHSGWVFHRAGANQTQEVRKVMTIIYMDKDMVYQQPANDSQRNDGEKWCPGARVNEVIDTPLNPVVYQAT